MFLLKKIIVILYAINLHFVDDFAGIFTIDERTDIREGECFGKGGGNFRAQGREKQYKGMHLLYNSKTKN